MNLENRIDLLVQLGQHILEEGDYLKATIHRTEFNNAWFTAENQWLSLKAIAKHFLDRNKLENWALTIAEFRS